MKKMTPACEIVKNIENSTDLELCGTDGIHQASHEYATLVYENRLSNKNCVDKIHGTGPSGRFYYSIHSYVDNSIVNHESGFGYCYIKNKKRFFKRELVLFTGKSINNNQFVGMQTLANYQCITSGINILITSHPLDYAFMFYEKNCVLTSIDTIIPHSFHLDKNCVLGRLEEDIANVSINDLRTAHTVKPKNPPVGSLYYDSAKDSIQVYNGTKWRTLRWEEEDNEE